MTLQCDGTNNIQETVMFELITINGKDIYYVDGYFYSLDTIPIINIFDSVSIQYHVLSKTLNCSIIVFILNITLYLVQARP